MDQKNISFRRIHPPADKVAFMRINKIKFMWITIALTAFPAQAGPMHRPTCASHDHIVAYLGSEVGEVPMAFARRTDDAREGAAGSVVEIFVGPMLTWTLVQTTMRDDGTAWACFVAYGDELQILEPPTKPGAPA